MAEQDAFTAPSDERALTAWLDRKLAAGRKSIAENEMRLNLAYTLGKQWVVWDGSANRFRAVQQDPRSPNAVVRVTANKIGGIVEHFIARMLKSLPEPQCRPVTDDDSDVAAARVGTRILLHELYRTDWQTLLLDLLFWTVPLGYSYLQVSWDAEAGTTIAGADDVTRGDIALSVVPAFELAVDPDAKTMTEARWAIRTVSMTKEAAWEKYGKVPAGGAPVRTLADDVRALATASATTGARDDRGDTLAVHQMWMVPCRAAPDGMVVTWSGTTVLDRTPFPYQHRRVPFIQLDLLPGIGQRAGRTWVTDLVPLQTDYNDARSREATLRRTIVPKLTAAAGSINPKNITTRADIVVYNPVGEPPRWTVPDSGWVAQHEAAMNRADLEMGDRAGQTDVSSGKAPSSSMAAAAIIALQEADDTRMAVSAKLLASFIREAGWHVLQLVKQFWTEERRVRTWSEANTLEVAQFSGSDLTDHLDVHVESESALPRSKSARVQLAMDLLGSGLPGTPASPFADWRDFIRMLDLPGTDFMVESLDVDTKQAGRENSDLMQGFIREVHLWDNHPVHIAEHERLRKSELYDEIERQAALGDPQAVQVKEAIDAHLTVHYQLVNPGVAYQPPPGIDGQALQDVSPDKQLYGDPLSRGAAPSDAATSGGASALSDTTVGDRAGIGGPGNPGPVPGVSVDEQAASMGA